jgi:hypothetical protein
VRARAPRRRVEHEADAVRAGQLDVRREVGAQRVDAVRIVEQRERCELRQLEAAFVDEPRLHAAVCEEEVVAQLRQHQPPSL